MLVECVPNFSEGRHAHVLAKILEPLQEIEDVRLLDHSLDPDHNRAVATLAGPAQAVGEAAFRLVQAAKREIDLTKHRGVHPRMGSTDVCPFVPLRGATFEDCVRLAHEVGHRIGRELGVPVFFYGRAALDPRREALPSVRRGGFEGLLEKMGTDPAYVPDAGPLRPHPTAGATAVGVRSFLIAFNVNLESTDLGLARSIAARVRASGGGLAGIRALGFLLEQQRTAQVSLNVCQPEVTGLVEVYDAIEELAQEAGVRIRESELIGLAPASALDDRVAAHVGLRDYDRRRMVIEEAL